MSHRFALARQVIWPLTAGCTARLSSSSSSAAASAILCSSSSWGITWVIEQPRQQSGPNRLQRCPLIMQLAFQKGSFHSCSQIIIITHLLYQCVCHSSNMATALMFTAFSRNTTRPQAIQAHWACHAQHRLAQQGFVSSKDIAVLCMTIEKQHAWQLLLHCCCDRHTQTH